MSTPAVDPLDLLTDLDDAALEAVIARAQELRRDRERSRRREALDQARAILAGAGLSVEDLMDGDARSGGRANTRPGSRPAARAAGGTRPSRASSASSVKAGTRYANPANPSQVYSPGRGRAPKWYAELKARGELPPPLD